VCSCSQLADFVHYPASREIQLSRREKSASYCLRAFLAILFFFFRPGSFGLPPARLFHSSTHSSARGKYNF
jgi:hypothetical protein